MKLYSPEQTEQDITAAKQELATLIQEKSILYGDFTLASGAKSTYYMDLRISTLSSRGNYLISYLLHHLIKQNGHEIDLIGGPALGACPIVTGISQLSTHLGSPIDSVYIRKESKGHGTGKDIEGKYTPGQTVILVEDVVTSGGSAIKAIEKLRESGLIIDHLYTVVLRDPKGIENLKAANINLEYLFTAEELLEQ